MRVFVFIAFVLLSATPARADSAFDFFRVYVKLLREERFETDNIERHLPGGGVMAEARACAKLVPRLTQLREAQAMELRRLNLDWPFKDMVSNIIELIDREAKSYRQMASMCALVDEPEKNRRAMALDILREEPQPEEKLVQAERARSSIVAIMVAALLDSNTTVPEKDRRMVFTTLQRDELLSEIEQGFGKEPDKKDFSGATMWILQNFLRKFSPIDAP